MQSLLTSGGAFTYQDRDIINQALASLGIVTPGNVWWVRPYSGTDSLNGTNAGLTSQTAFKTLAFALSQATADQNDVVLLCAESNTAAKTTDYQSANLAWSKNGVHLVGVNAGTFCSPRSRISNASAAASYANLFTLSASGCLIYGIEFYHGAGSNTLSAAQTCVTVSGERNRFVGCAISGIGDTTLDYAGSNSLTVSNSENIFQHCYIGLDTVIRATATYEVSITTAARTIFEDCHFASYTSLTTWKAVNVASTADRFVKFRDCEFEAVQNISSAAVPTGAIACASMNGSVMVIRPALVGYALLVTGGSAYVKTLSWQNATTVQGVCASAAAS